MLSGGMNAPFGVVRIANLEGINCSQFRGRQVCREHWCSNMLRVNIEKSKVGLWVDINKQSYSLNTQVTKCEMDLSELKWKGWGKIKRTAMQHVYIAELLRGGDRLKASWNGQAVWESWKGVQCNMLRWPHYSVRWERTGSRRPDHPGGPARSDQESYKSMLGTKPNVSEPIFITDLYVMC